MIDPKYLNLHATPSPTLVIYGSPIKFVPLKLHRKYSIFVRLMRNPLPSKASLHSSNLLLAFSLVSAAKTKSSTKIMHHGTLSHKDLEISSIMIVKTKGFSVDPAPCLT